MAKLKKRGPVIFFTIVLILVLLNVFLFRSVQVFSVSYDPVKEQIIVSVSNNGVSEESFIGEYTIVDSSGKTQRFGDLTPVSVEGRGVRTLRYDVEPIEGHSIDAEVIFRSGRWFFKKETKQQFDVPFIAD
ncbi:MAG: hypothetical protein GY861_27100 [bacterium]|nr:hypothetical protein [bacterium]